jgi:hypothetical protein
VVVVGSVVGVVVVVGRVVDVVCGGDVTGGDGAAGTGTGGNAKNGAAPRVVVVVRARRVRWARSWLGEVVDEVSGATTGTAARETAFVVVVVVATRDVGEVALTRSAFTSVEPARGSVPMRQTPTTISASATKSSMPLRNWSSGLSRRIRRTSLRTPGSLSATFTAWPCELCPATARLGIFRTENAAIRGGAATNRRQLTSARPIIVSKLPL